MSLSICTYSPYIEPIYPHLRLQKRLTNLVISIAHLNLFVISCFLLLSTLEILYPWKLTIDISWSFIIHSSDMSIIQKFLTNLTNHWRWNHHCNDAILSHILWNHLNSWGSIFEVCQIFTGSWERNFVDRLVGEEGVERKDNSEKVDLFETSYLSLQWLLKSLNDDDAGIAPQVDLKTSTLKATTC